MQRRKIWVGLSTAVLVAAPAATQAAMVPMQARAGFEASAEQDLVTLAQHKGHGADAAKAKPATEGEGGEGEGGGSAKLEPALHVSRGIGMIRGHLTVGNELVEAGRWADAMPHFLHPEEEIYGELREDLKGLGIAPFQVALKALSQTVKAKNKDAYLRARAVLDERLAAADAALRAKQTDNTYFTLETALEVLQQAADEYAEAIKKGRIVNIVEYQDARGFVAEADRLVGSVAEAADAKSADSLKTIRASLGDLKAAFPTLVPPQKAVKDSGEFLSSIAKFELQLGNFR